MSKMKKEKYLKNMKYQPITIEMGEGNKAVYLDKRAKVTFTDAMQAQLKNPNSHLGALIKAESVKVIELAQPENQPEPQIVEKAIVENAERKDDQDSKSGDVGKKKKS